MEFVSTSVLTHIIAIVALLLIMSYNYYQVLTQSEFIPLAKKLRFTTPIYHMSNAIVAYTGGIVAAYSHDLSPTVVLMVATSIFVMVLEIKRYKKMRVIKSSDHQKQVEFVLFAKKIYTMEIGAVLFTYIVSKIF
jgi:4-hydroxybenzoate polyprenyltransferase